MTTEKTIFHLNRRYARRCIAERRDCGQKRHAWRHGVPYKYSPEGDYGIVSPVRERESCYVHGKSQYPLLIGREITSLS